MAKATTTIRQMLNFRSDHCTYFAANQSLFNRVAFFYFDMIQAHIKVLDFSNKEALTALEKLTHATEINPHPIMPLSDIQEDIPALFRRAAINAALGSARSFSSLLSKWRKREEKAETKGKKFTERPPVPSRTWNKSSTLYAGMWKERMGSSSLIKVWTGTCWSWIRIRIAGREIPDGVDLGSPQLVRRGKLWWLHTPVEKQFGKGPSIPPTGHGDRNEHGTAQEQGLRMVEPVRDITNPLRPQSGWSYAPTARGSDDVGVSEAAGL